MNTQAALQLMQETFESMQRSGMVPDTITFNSDTVILGVGSVLDSLGFVTFISDLEERLCTKLDDEVYLVHHEIEAFNANSSFLSAGTIARFIESITPN